MARANTSPTQRLKRLNAALPAAKEMGKGGKKLTATPMCDLLGVNWKTLRSWCDEPGGDESGAFQRGSNGIEWQFKPVATVRWLIAKFDAKQKAGIAEAKKQHALIGATALQGVPEDYDLDKITKSVKASALIRDERKAWGQLVDAGRTAQVIRAVFVRMQETGVKAASEQDPSGLWPPHIRESFDEAVSNVLISMAQAGEEALSVFERGTS